jgi:hypothetical protein
MVILWRTHFSNEQALLNRSRPEAAWFSTSQLDPPSRLDLGSYRLCESCFNLLIVVDLDQVHNVWQETQAAFAHHRPPSCTTASNACGKCWLQNVQPTTDRSERGERTSSTESGLPYGPLGREAGRI